MRSAAAKNCSGLSLPAHIGPWGTAGSTGDVYMGTGGEHARSQAQVLSLGCVVAHTPIGAVVPAGDWGQDMLTPELFERFETIMQVCGWGKCLRIEKC